MNTRYPLRVLTIVSNTSKTWEQSPAEIISRALQVIAKKKLYETGISESDTTLLAIQYYRTRKWFVFDILNERYDPARGHRPEDNALPVVVIHLSNREDIASRPHPEECARINEIVRHLHDANGFGSTPPFIEDHTSGTPPNYPNPRSLTHSPSPQKAH